MYGCVYIIPDLGDLIGVGLYPPTHRHRKVITVGRAVPRCSVHEDMANTVMGAT